MTAEREGSGSGEAGPLPSEAELRVLRGLWEEGEQTVRALHERLAPGWDVGYTTVLKLLQRMHEKGLVSRRPEGRAHVYRPAIAEGPAERRLVRDLASRAFGGSVRRLVQRALPAELADPEELAAIERLLERLEGEEPADDEGRPDEGRPDGSGSDEGRSERAP